MGKKARKTRWRTLTITDEHSDSEESSTTTTQRLPKSYQQKSYYNKFSYSSQSTPRRRYQNDSSKSTRSSSTASENKITFNEDEYTRITTPRQDVLFKKGYLNKPRNYQTQTSTGTSTTSTGNSTGNGTPDHQSTDLEYESQFVFPNGFVDQNGIYYINGYESYPLMLYNPPTYYTEFSNRKSKRYSTGSLTESMSPNNEEATSQDLSGGEASNHVSDFNGHHQLYNMVYPGYYINGVCPPHDIMNGQCPTDQNRRTKKRRRRKTSKSQTTQNSSERSESESDICDEEEASSDHLTPLNSVINCHIQTDNIKTATVVSEEKENCTEEKEDSRLTEETEPNIENGGDDKTDKTEDLNVETLNEKIQCSSPALQEESQKNSLRSNSPEVHQSTTEISESLVNEENLQHCPSECTVSKKSDLKPDAEEFIPRAYRSAEVTIDSNIHFLKVPQNFVPIPILPLGEFNGQNFSPAFIPPGIPINFLPPDPKMFPNFVSFVPNGFVSKGNCVMDGNRSNNTEHVNNQTEQIEVHDKSNTAKIEKIHQTKISTDKNIVQNVNSKTIDIATIVSKLEVAAKEQEDQDAKKINKQVEETQDNHRRKYLDNKSSKASPRYKNYRKSYYYSPQNSPQKKNICINEDTAVNNEKSEETNKATISPREPTPEQKLETKEVAVSVELQNGALVNGKEEIVHSPKYSRNSPEKHKKIWKQQHYQNGSPKWHQNGNAKDFRNRQNNKIHGESDAKDFKARQNYKNYSETLKQHKSEQRYSEVSNNEKQKNYFDTLKCSPKIETPTVLSLKEQNQWISVSNRKKRKNKNMEETDEKEDEHFRSETFENCDVDLLFDVPLTEDEIIKVETTEELTESVSNSPETKVNSIDNIEDSTITMISIPGSYIEEQPIVITNMIEPEEITPELKDVSKDSDTFIEEVEELPELNVARTENQTVESNKNKKKSKKGTQKPLTKRIIITDLDLSLGYEDIKKPIKKVVTKVVDTKNSTDTAEEKQKTEKQEVTNESPTGNEEEEKKKRKKKKKKPSKMVMANSSLSSSSTTINVVDDAYEFLLDSALSDESMEKTNIEVSQELDKLIQKGMYNSLEEKIKSLNIDESDGFFKSIFSRISSRESSVEKTGFTKSPDLSKILQNTRNLCSPCSVSQDNISQNRNINKMLPDLDSPAEDGFFLENSNVNEVLQDQAATKDMDNEETKIKDSVQDCEATSGEIKLESEVEPKSYPITQAVKEWMSKTREKTPDVVLLKSPSAIFKEFCDSASDSDDEVTDSKNIIDDDEILIFRKEKDSSKESVEQPDLMEYWENDLVNQKTTNGHYDNDDKDSLNISNKHVEEGEDVMEVYESKYGKNEDYLNLQKEVREKVNNSNYSRHGNLPYRAICCSIM